MNDQQPSCVTVHTWSRMCVCWVAALCLPMLGCGSDEIGTYPVSVKVTGPDGKPMVGVRVSFQSVGEKTLARGTTSSDGTAMLMTHSAGDGAVAGQHQAAVRPPAMYGDLDRPAPKVQIPARFNSYESSGLEFNVVPGGDNNFEIVITLK